MAIAFGALTQLADFGGTSLTGPTVSGSDTWGFFFIASASEATTATWNGVSMTKLQGGGAGFFGISYALFAIQNPGSGSTVSATAGASTGNSMYAWYYTGVGSIRSSAENSSGGVPDTTGTLSQTTVVDDWVTGVFYTGLEDITVTGGTARGTQQSDANGGRTRPADRTATTTTTDLVATWASAAYAIVGAVMEPASAVSAAVTGTITGGTTEQDIRDGGKTIILTLTGDTWVASGATFDAQRQNIIDGLDAASSPAGGWNAEVRDALPVTAVVRTSATVVTVTLPAFADYQITATETITATIPASAVSLGGAIVASPTFSVVRGADDMVQPASPTNGSGVATGSMTSDAVGLTRLTATVDGVLLDDVVVITKVTP